MNGYKIVSNVVLEMSAMSVRYARSQAHRLRQLLQNSNLPPAIKAAYQNQLQKFKDIIIRFGHIA
jgi:hypothetical protein